MFSLSRWKCISVILIRSYSDIRCYILQFSVSVVGWLFVHAKGSDNGNRTPDHHWQQALFGQIYWSTKQMIAGDGTEQSDGPCLSKCSINSASWWLQLYWRCHCVVSHNHHNKEEKMRISKWGEKENRKCWTVIEPASCFPQNVFVGAK